MEMAADLDGAVTRIFDEQAGCAASGVCLDGAGGFVEEVLSGLHAGSFVVLVGTLLQKKWRVASGEWLEKAFWRAGETLVFVAIRKGDVLWLQRVTAISNKKVWRLI
jgi:hypothetical protein